MFAKPPPLRAQEGLQSVRQPVEDEEKHSAHHPPGPTKERREPIGAMHQRENQCKDTHCEPQRGKQAGQDHLSPRESSEQSHEGSADEKTSSKRTAHNLKRGHYVFSKRKTPFKQEHGREGTGDHAPTHRQHESRQERGQNMPFEMSRNKARFSLFDARIRKTFKIDADRMD